MTCDFCTFCYSGIADKFYAPGQLKKLVETNNYVFDNVIIVYQCCSANDYPKFNVPFNIKSISIADENEIDEILAKFNIDKPQYVSSKNRKHFWKYHTVNHLRAILEVESDYVVMCHADCWMLENKDYWVEKGIEILHNNPNIFIVSPGDGEGERLTQRISQQMFLTRTSEFKCADFNQPDWDENPHVPGGPFPEYWGALEGRMELHCRKVEKYRYVLSDEYRYWHYQW
jgi:hypothetical protein